MANASGIIKLGHVTLGSLADLSNPATLTINELMKCVHTTIPITGNRKSFTLYSAVINHGIANVLNKSIQQSTITTDKISEVFAQEMVAFAIIESPYRSITGGTLTTYNFDVRIAVNYAFNPKPYDSFSNSLENEELEDWEK